MNQIAFKMQFQIKYPTYTMTHVTLILVDHKEPVAMASAHIPSVSLMTTVLEIAHVSTENVSILVSTLVALMQSVPE